MPASDGKALVAGYDVVEQPLEAKRRTGYLPETPPLYTEMSVRDYLMFCASIKGVPRAERRARVNNAMERTRIHTPLTHARHVSNPILDALGLKNRRALDRAVQNAKRLPPGLGPEHVALGRDGEFVLAMVADAAAEEPLSADK